MRPGSIVNRWKLQQQSNETITESRPLLRNAAVFLAAKAKIISANMFLIVLHFSAWMLACGFAIGTIVFLYMAFYQAYIPSERLSLPVYFDYGQSPHPGTTFTLPSPSRAIEYDISLQLSVPDQAGLSEHLGNVMLELEISEESTGAVITKVRRPTLLVYRSWPVRAAMLAVRLAPVVLGWANEATTHRIFLLEHFSIPPPPPKGSIINRQLRIRLTIDKPDLPIYEASFDMVAHFRGLRYFMYYWRWSFAVAMVGLLSLLSVLVISFLVLTSLIIRLIGAAGTFGSDNDEVKSVGGSESETASHGSSETNSDRPKWVLPKPVVTKTVPMKPHSTNVNEDDSGAGVRFRAVALNGSPSGGDATVPKASQDDDHKDADGSHDDPTAGDSQVSHED